MGFVHTAYSVTEGETAVVCVEIRMGMLARNVTLNIVPLESSSQATGQLQFNIRTSASPCSVEYLLMQVMTIAECQ